MYLAELLGESLRVEVDGPVEATRPPQGRPGRQARARLRPRGFGPFSLVAGLLLPAPPFGLFGVELAAGRTRRWARTRGTRSGRPAGPPRP